jgi:hypothetical protein
MPILKSWSFNITREVYPFLGIYVEALSPKSAPLLIIAIGLFHVYMLRSFVPGHDDMDRRPHQFPF